MAQPALEAFKKKKLLLKAEAVPGQDALPTGAADTFMMFDGTISYEFDKVERPVDRDFFGGDPFGKANLRARIEGDIELYPPATPGAVATSDAYCGRILLPAGFAVVKDAVAKTTRYSPISSGVPTATAYWYRVRRETKVTGARANLSGLAIEIGQRFKGKASLQGKYKNWTTQAIPAGSFPSKVPVIASSENTLTLISSLVRGATESTDATPLTDLHVWAKSLSIDLGNDLKHKEYTELAVDQIDDRKPTFTLRLASTDITNDFDPQWISDNGIILQISLTLFEKNRVGGVHSGLYSKLAIRCQVENFTETDIDGDDGWELTGPCIPSDAGGDELYIEFGDQA